MSRAVRRHALVPSFVVATIAALVAALLAARRRPARPAGEWHARD